MADTDPSRSSSTTRKRAFTIFGGVFAVAAIGYLGYEWIEGGRYVETDNAYVNADIAQVTPQCRWRCGHHRAAARARNARQVRDRA